MAFESVTSVDDGKHHVSYNYPVSDKRNCQSTKCVHHVQSVMCQCTHYSVNTSCKISMLHGTKIHHCLLDSHWCDELRFLSFSNPKLCISASTKFINSLLFDYILAIYPLIFTAFMYLSIELHDRKCWVVTCLSYPVRKLYKFFSNRNWNPKITILDTGATFLLLSYSKFLYTSINLLFAVQSYDENGTSSNHGSAVLLYDPTIRFLHSEHIPYVVLALSVMVVFVLPPPVLLLLHPTKIFRKCLDRCGFQRWDLLQLIMDIFQGWYKDEEKKQETTDHCLPSTFC